MPEIDSDDFAARAAPFEAARGYRFTVELVRRAAVVVLALAAVCGCQRSQNALTVAVALLPDELSVYRDVLAEFERHTGLTVVVVPQQYADIRRALAAEAVSRQGTLDLVELDVYSLAAAAPLVSDLDPEAFGADLQVLTPEAVAVGQINDGGASRLRFLPHRLSWQALIYNHAVLGKPPATWADLLAVARAHPGQIAVKGALYEGLTCDVLPFVWSAGGSGETFDDAGARAAFDFFAELSPYLHPQSPVFKEAAIAEAMARGEIVLHLNWPFVMSLYAAQGLAPDTIRSAPLPSAPNGARRATVLGGGYIGIPRAAPHRAAALQLARFLIGAPAQRRLHESLGWFSARRDLPVSGSAELLDGFAAMRADVRPRPTGAGYARLSRLWQQAFRAVVFEHAEVTPTLQEAQRNLTGAPR